MSAGSSNFDHALSRLPDHVTALEASRVTQNKVEVRKLPMDLRAVVTEAAAAARSMMTSHNLTFTSTIDQRPLTIAGDAARLQQVCVNLLTNAAKYTPRGGTVATRSAPRSRRQERRPEAGGRRPSTSGCGSSTTSKSLDRRCMRSLPIETYVSAMSESHARSVSGVGSCCASSKRHRR